MTNKSGLKKVKVACILDTFSYECFKYECDLLYLMKSSWRAQIQEFQPDFLFVESFWNGMDGSWEANIVDMNYLDNEVAKLISYCNDMGIKTVFWNKEDPPNYYRFLNAAKLFDYVFTTDEKCIPYYKRDLGHDNIWSLSFAAQPEIHNPIGHNYCDKDGIAFAGSWYNNKHFLRQIEMKTLLDGVLEDTLIIYDRNYNEIQQTDNLKFPKEYQLYIEKSLTYSEMLQAYKKHKVFLNVNSVRDSDSMFSRRVYEILASGSHVISTYSIGILNRFKGIVPIVYSESDVKKAIKEILLDKDFGKKISIRGIREVYKQHLYSHRMNEILERIDVEKSVIERNILVVGFINSYDEAVTVFESFNRQSYPNKELIIFNVGIENIEMDRVVKTDSYEKVIHDIDFDFISIFSYSCYYGVNFLIDLFHASLIGKTEVIGKASFFSYYDDVLFEVNPGHEFTYEHEFTLHPFTMLVSNRLSKKIQFNTLDIKNLNDTNSYISLFKSALNESIIFSSDQYSFLDRLSMTGAELSTIHSDFKLDSAIQYVCADDIAFSQKHIPEKEYVQSLIKKIFSQDYPGLNSLLKNEVDCSDSKIVIYGAGDHTKKVLRTIDKRQFNIIGIVDKNENLRGQKIDCIQVYSLDELALLEPQYIYISSRAFEEEIYNELTKSIGEKYKIIPMYLKHTTFADDIYKELFLEDFSPRAVGISVFEKCNLNEGDD
ncbi:hypothetical protein BHU72_00260 [Desulfuribacillus stibiiarsenatis]|uniref:DUF3880 domain-containing protein n=1 Tax=Desulfuribacillus stibiiarsenatis TaxID=1390249 RepID=A0A1E5L9N9_9FIRM|nr:glycosyltransferase [Desulfuribacillus stibiiarsenatis]OEH86744.1 hypothetical protein BHU72_00260 [Desulfuribacillus stibiiarsenatis]